MIIDLSPDYVLFMKILFVWWILRGIVMVLAGLSHTKRDKRDTYGMFDVFDGVVFLLIAVLVMI